LWAGPGLWIELPVLTHTGVSPPSAIEQAECSDSLQSHCGYSGGFILRKNALKTGVWLEIPEEWVTTLKALVRRRVPPLQTAKMVRPVLALPARYVPFLPLPRATSLRSP
jgi:hypothetical protein